MIARKIIPVKNWITPSKLPGVDFVINPYVGCPHKCVYCYAEFMKTFTNHPEDWGEFLDIKQCDKAITGRRLDGKSLVISSVTDPYNAFEQEYRLTRQILEQLHGSGAHITIITKSDLVLRDIDLISRIENIEVALSVNSLDDMFRRHVEPRAPTAKRRLDALRQLHESGIQTVLFMSPIFPGITDFRAIVEASRQWVDTYWFENLNLNTTARNKVARAIGQHYPELIPLYRSIYREGDRTYWHQLIEDIEGYCRETDIAFRNVFHP